jgi:PAS domain S-box-containing protein
MIQEGNELDMQMEQETTLDVYASRMLLHVPVGIALVDAYNLCFLAANPCYQSYLQAEGRHAQIVGRPLSDGIPVLAQDTLVDLTRSVIQTGCSSQLKAVPGTHRYWNWNLDPIREQGQVTAVLLTLTEVTNQVMAEREAREAQKALFSQMHETIAQQWQQQTYVEKILSSLHHAASPQALAQEVLDAIILCFAPPLVALYSKQPGQETLSLLSSNQRELEAEAFPETVMKTPGSPLFQVMQQRTPLVKSDAQPDIYKHVNEVEERGMCHAFSSFPSMAYIPLWSSQCEGVLVVGLEGEDEARSLLLESLIECAPHLAGALADARLHEALAHSQHRLHTVLDQLPEGIILVEARNGKIHYANEAAAGMLGLTLPRLVGVSLNQSAFLSPYGRSKSHQQSAFRWNFALIDALWGKKVTNQELVISRPDGSEIVVLSSCAPIRTQRGLISEAVMVFADITALKQLDQQKSEFFAIANHELRTPLTAILGFAEILKLSAPHDADEMYQYATTSIMEESEHLTHLIDDLLDVSRLEFGHLDLKKKYQDLLPSLTRIVTKYMQQSSQNRVFFRREEVQPTERLMGWFDSLRIEQILNNLLMNALKYSSADSKIEVGVRLRSFGLEEQQEVEIWVKDQGIGIPAQDQPYIFERFYRASTLESSKGGFGIGLYLTKQLVQGHKGRIWVESTFGKGSTFFVVLPLGGMLV